MKSLTLFAAAAVFTCAVSAQHHGGYEHADHDLGKNEGHDDHDQSVHDPLIQEQPNVEIQTKPPVVVLKTITRTKPWAIVPDQKTITKTVKYNAPTFRYGYDHDNNHGSGHDRDHSNHDHPEDHSRDHGDSRQRQKGRLRQQIHANFVSPKQGMNGHLAAAAVSSAGRTAISSAAAAASHTAVRSAPAASSKVNQAASPSVARSVASPSVAPSMNDANSLPMHSIFITVTAVMAAWLLLL
ncbi:hypothetical protein G6F46_010723 [Rhizopus delemar]|uniref:Uncharacterized protein n=3 Tax=Rhizopus TaxID=4842 RepID=I1BUR5_RHIO9|nr:hypothetical protein RO3G_04650 [Rhizopus delemar RA 99-880]KAG1448870.1 hypothetical protein G6F55_010433 [Rhizopus delemar]KAG1550498.1 hypothetical protein G6F51_002420 [Rhizopus arrhizus]KAG1490137.1 hypothetical protein G6F54_010946 [Rhizopus delemar]KAG1501608.1 hypothetical protein G6F53_011043 [Rhizopus delemar]|eukprot:EIE79945.1 hypothetical protein RO3G_04650 [Rhizopus delemar RA 99-880]